MILKSLQVEGLAGAGLGADDFHQRLLLRGCPVIELRCKRKHEGEVVESVLFERAPRFQINFQDVGKRVAVRKAHFFGASGKVSSHALLHGEADFARGKVVP